MGGKEEEDVSVSDETMTRVRAIRQNMQDKLHFEHFTQDPLKSRACITSTVLRPTQASQIALMYDSRTISHAINSKRHCTVRERRSLYTTNEKCENSHFFRIPCIHTLRSNGAARRYY